MPKNSVPLDRRKVQFIGISIDQVTIEDEIETSRKMGDNKAAAIPASGALQHKPQNRDCKAKHAHHWFT